MFLPSPVLPSKRKETSRLNGKRMTETGDGAGDLLPSPVPRLPSVLKENRHAPETTP